MWGEDIGVFRGWSRVVTQMFSHPFGGAYSEKVKVAQLSLALCNPMEFSRPESWNGQPFPSPGHLPNPGIEPRSSTLQVDSLPVETQGKLKNNGVGSLSLLQWIFTTQEQNQGLLHCRGILYQLTYQGSPSQM